jgi:hypothetical protein
MNRQPRHSGFSLIEINMAIFVMAIGVLAMVALYPLGLRESVQGSADLKQSMFADYVLNQVVAIASQTNVTWSQWQQIPHLQGRKIDNLSDKVPSWISGELDMTEYPRMRKDIHYKLGCCIVPGASDRVMGVMVQSTDMYDTVSRFDQVTNNPIYYAEVMFQGIPR